MSEIVLWHDRAVMRAAAAAGEYLDRHYTGGKTR